MKSTILMTLTILLISMKTFSHGENMFGPHQGYIRMPGAFHVELVPKKDDIFFIYLMDVNNKNPVTKDSSVDFTYKFNNKSSAFSCTTMHDHFVCTKPGQLNFKVGQLLIKASRLGKPGGFAIYQLPLMLTGKKIK